jgi:hypothetical protein
MEHNIENGGPNRISFVERLAENLTIAANAARIYGPPVNGMA